MGILDSSEAWRFWARWTLATVAGWVAGLMLAIILSFLVVNLFYPQETNLIVGLCLGATVSYLQRFAVRRWVTLPPIYVWGGAIGIGAPFVVVFSLNVAGIEPGADASVALLAAGSLLCGLLQLPALRGLAAGPWLWAPSTFVLWTAAWSISRVPSAYALLGAAVLHGAASGGVLIWLLARKTEASRLPH